MGPQSALIIDVPEAEAAVGQHRELPDDSALRSGLKRKSEAGSAVVMKSAPGSGVADPIMSISRPHLLDRLCWVTLRVRAPLGGSR